ncbi:MAG: hypothetical protein ACREK8_06310 [Gemmatimonadales bacterium]
MLTRLALPSRLAGLLLLQIGLLASPVNHSPIDPALYRGMVWRNIGPFRGGRVSAVSGVIGIPGTFYAGYPLGGVWKTTGAGTTWTPVFDAVHEASSVGAIEVAPSDPNVIYVGMGDLVTGGGINEGNGVYKSTDAGQTWRHLGLDDTRQIPSILVDPHNPNLVLIAAQGNIHVPGPMRGVFRSTDGGATWAKTLFINDTIGVQKIAWAYDRPSVIFATTVRHYTPITGGRGAGAGGSAGAPTASGTAVYKSTDEGVTWHELSGGNLPSLNGRTSIAVAMTTNAERVYLISNNGLFRSDDGGQNWRQMDAGDTRIRNGQGGYNCGVYVDPKNPDIVYTINTSSYKSTDGGNTFTGFKGAPGGDDPQQLWIDPTDGKRMLMGLDQGASVSLDGGLTWSLWYNQPTSQVYHISVDNQYPYWVYASQQDAGSIATRSRGDLGEITSLDWLPIAGYEFGTVAADPRDPRIIYAGGPAAGLVKITYPSGQWINISPNLDTSLALRKVGNQPIQWSATNPRELLVGFNHLMATTDGGMHWKKLSPDLGYPKGVTPPPRTAATGRGGRGAGGGTGAPVGGSIESISSSSIAPGTIWVGTNNGLVKLTRDHGVTWEDVTVPDLPNPTRADISTVEASRHNPGEAYLAIDYHTSADYRPYFYRTRDYGRTWTKIVTGLPTDQPSGSFARVIREDTRKAGLLFAGTESSMYVSFDDGDTWEDLSLNLPNTSFRDLVIKDNDLVAGTYGRGIWILDDISPLRQLTPAIAAEPAHLFKPGEAIRVRRNVNGDTPFPPEVPHAENPPVGAIIYYYLSNPAPTVTIDVTDAAGKPVRHYSNAPIPKSEIPPPVPNFWLEQPEPLPDGAGMHRINWNLRYDDPPAFTHNYEINANPGETPASPEGPLALPGVYTVTLTVEGKSYAQTVAVRNDPRSPATAADLALQHAAQMTLDHGAETAWTGYQQVTAARAAVADVLHENPESDVANAARSLDSALARVGGTRGSGGRGGGGFGGRGGGGPPAAPNFATLVGTMTRQLGTLDPGDMAPNDVTRAALADACHDLRAAVVAWNAIATSEMPAFNALLAKHNRKAITVAPVLTALTCGVTPAIPSSRAR